ncbi:MAG: response regulator [Candidatus Omnitrophica bacterium]|nr:response regulator [Candidatus Omnitrophota bacterium]
MRKMNMLNFIGCALSIFYTILMVVYYLDFRMNEHGLHSLILSVIFLVLSVSSFFMGNQKNWARVVVLWGNLVLGVYGSYLSFYFPSFLSPSYVIMFAVTATFFHLPSVRGWFEYLTKKNWECILIIDDDLTSIKIARSILVNQGYSVLTTTSGEEGLETAREKNPDLILLDVIMPGLKGREVCRKLKADENTRHIPVVFLTAKDSVDDIKAEMDAGAETHLTKPVNRGKLLSTVSKLLDRKNGQKVRSQNKK